MQASFAVACIVVPPTKAENFQKTRLEQAKLHERPTYVVALLDLPPDGLVDGRGVLLVVLPQDRLDRLRRLLRVVVRHGREQVVRHVGVRNVVVGCRVTSDCGQHFE
jgi:hypothetical protein